jgi:hypothetical protein
LTHDEILKNWLNLTRGVVQMDDPRDLLRLLRAEKGGRNRPSVLLRIYGRYSRVRELIEKEQLVRGAGI